MSVFGWRGELVLCAQSDGRVGGEGNQTFQAGATGEVEESRFDGVIGVVSGGE